MEKLTYSEQCCSICGSPTLEPHDKEFRVCLQGCAVRTNHNYDGAQYNRNYAETYVQYAKSPVNVPLNLFRLGLVSRWLKPEHSILDIGCCIGEFLRFAEKYYNCVGFEPNKTAADIATFRLKRSTVIVSNLNGHKKFNCITMFDVLEHIQDPKEFLFHIKSILQPGGILAITTPNLAAVPGVLFDRGICTTDLRNWKHYKPTEHLWLHTKESLSKLLLYAGLSPVHWGVEESEIRPGNPNGDILTCVARRNDG